jgi:hypothetical protein
MKVKINSLNYLKDTIEENASVIDNKFYYLPFWFEKIENSNEYIMHRMEKLPIELSSRIRSMRESVKPILIVDYTVQTHDGEMSVRVDDGGIATIRHNGERFLTDYYHDRDDNDIPNWEKLAEGKMSCREWPEDIEEISNVMIGEALEWLYVSSEEVQFRRVEESNFKFK